MYVDRKTKLNVHICCAPARSLTNYTTLKRTSLHIYTALFKHLSIPIHSTATAAIHNWHGNVPHGLELDVGDSVEILEENDLWLRGTCPRMPRAVGLFPRTYIHVKDSAKADPIVTECTQVLREWSETWKKLFVVRVIVSLMTEMR